MSDSRTLFSQSSLVFVAAILSGGLSYLFNTLLGRLLGPAAYGSMSALISILNIVAIGGASILTVCMQYANRFYYSGQYGALNRLFRRFTRHVLLVAAVLLVVAIFISPEIAGRFSLSSPLPIIIAFASLLFSLTGAVNKGMMQGLRLFLPLSIANIAEMAVRLTAGIILVRMGFGLSGAFEAVLIGAGVSYFLTALPLIRFVNNNLQGTEEPVFLNRKEIVKYAAPSFLSAAFLAILINIDTIFVKSYFPKGGVAGLYASVSTVASVILYATSPIVAVMFPMITEKRTKHLRHYRTFLLALVTTALGCGVILTIYTIAPKAIMRLLYGQAYVGLFNLLPQVGLYVAAYSLVNFMCNYFLAVQDFAFIWIFAATVALQFILVANFHQSPAIIVHILQTTTIALLFLLLGRYAYTKKGQLVTLASTFMPRPTP